MPKIQTVVPRYKRASGKVADILLVNMEQLEYGSDDPDHQRAPVRTMKPITVTPAGVDVSDSEASYITALHARVKVMEETNYKRMNKESLLAAAFVKGYEPDPKMTNASLIDLLENGPKVEPEDDPDVEPEANPED